MRARLVALAVVTFLIGGIIAAVARNEEDERADVGAAVLDQPLRDQVMWVLGLINDGRGQLEIEARLAPSFLEAVPVSQLVAIATDLRGRGPFTIAGVVEAAPIGATLRLRAGKGRPYNLQISLEPLEPSR